MKVISALLFVLLLAMSGACASGSDTGDDDDTVQTDARVVTADAALPRDTGLPSIDSSTPTIDSAIPRDSTIPTPDSTIPPGDDGGGVPGMCTVNTDCPSSECCLIAICIPGMRLPDGLPITCLPF